MNDFNPAQLIEFVKRTTLIALVSDDELMDQLVLKGGNALDLIYGISTRASMDLDFSVPGDIGSTDAVRAKVEPLLDSTFSEFDLVPFDLRVVDVPPHLSDDLKHFWGGYCIEFKLVGQDDYSRLSDDVEALRRHSKSIGPRGSTKFKIEISRHEMCDGRVARNIGNYRIFVYSPEMIVAEKLRAICQQMPQYGPIVRRSRPPASRARDFVDIHTVCTSFPMDFRSAEVQELVRRTFQAKKVPLMLLSLIADARDLHEQSFPAVQATVKPGFALEEFETYFDFVLQIGDELKPLWHE